MSKETFVKERHRTGLRSFLYSRPLEVHLQAQFVPNRELVFLNVLNLEACLVLWATVRA